MLKSSTTGPRVGMRLSEQAEATYRECGKIHGGSGHLQSEQAQDGAVTALDNGASWLTLRWGRESWGHNEEDEPEERDAVATGASVLPPEGPSVEGASLFPAEAASLAPCS
uniref:Uncharacterized protein n=1 Tax=Rangifer tarandus platyrhynchus TaxID=3082113 RepID=A0ACB0EJA9_RANTA|nr:unnamed protein product [Rangifer tarandus platyrhynchus]